MPQGEDVLRFLIIVNWARTAGHAVPEHPLGANTLLTFVYIVCRDHDSVFFVLFFQPLSSPAGIIPHPFIPYHHCLYSFTLDLTTPHPPPAHHLVTARFQISSSPNIATFVSSTLATQSFVSITHTSQPSSLIPPPLSFETSVSHRTDNTHDRHHSDRILAVATSRRRLITCDTPLMSSVPARRLRLPMALTDCGSVAVCFGIRLRFRFAGSGEDPPSCEIRN
jgi:hypothetical protein